MGVIFKNGIQYSEVDGDYLPLTGGNVTGPTNFGDSVDIDELTVGNLVVNGSLTVNNNDDGVGTVYTAAWTATSSAANNTQVTESLNLPAGIYIFSLKAPVCSQASVYFGIYPFGLENSSSFTGVGGTSSGQTIVTSIGILTQPATVYAQTNMSTSTTYTYIERGYLKAIRIA